MGNHQTKDIEFEQAKRKFSEPGLQALQQAYLSMAAQSRSERKYVIASVFQAYYGIHGSLGARLFELVTQHRHDKQLYFEDLIIAKAKYEKSSPGEIEEYTYLLLDLLNDGHVTRTDVEAVVLSVLETVLGPKETIPESSLQAFLNAAPFSDRKRLDRRDTSQELRLKAGEDDGGGQGEGEDEEPAMTMQDYRKWCQAVPSIKKFLGSLLTEPSSGPAGRSVPELAAAEEVRDRLLLRPEHAWHLSGMLQEKDTREWLLLYHSGVHGLSFNTFMGRISAFPGPTVLVVQDKGGAVFGGFASQPWERHSDFFGDLKSFLFTLSPAAAIYRPSGANTNIQWCAMNFTSESIPNGIGFGGQIHHFGFFLEAGFDHGHSRPSVTFNSPSLSSSPIFTPDVIECWAVMPISDTEEGGKVTGGGLKGTVLERFKEDRAMLNMVGIANASENTGS